MHVQSHDIAPQLDAFVRAAPTAAQVEQGLAALGYLKGSPGFRAVSEPVTPVDKAFQIYSLSLSLSYNFGPESFLHDQLWAARDKAWSLAASWLIENEEPFKSVPKSGLRALHKNLPEALRVQCSHELPPGTPDKFPKDAMRQSKEMAELTNTLQHMGLNRKIRAMDLIEPSGIHWAAPAIPLKDYGTLEALLTAAEQLHTLGTPLLMPQASLF